MFSTVLDDQKKKQYVSPLYVGSGAWHYFENPKSSLRFQIATSLLSVPYNTSIPPILMSFSLNNVKETLPCFTKTHCYISRGISENKLETSDLVNHLLTALQNENKLLSEPWTSITTDSDSF